MSCPPQVLVDAEYLDLFGCENSESLFDKNVPQQSKVAFKLLDLAVFATQLFLGIAITPFEPLVCVIEVSPDCTINFVMETNMRPINVTKEVIPFIPLNLLHDGESIWLGIAGKWMLCEVGAITERDVIKDHNLPRLTSVIDRPTLDLLSVLIVLEHWGSSTHGVGLSDCLDTP
jgi:hypothetical protein